VYIEKYIEKKIENKGSGGKVIFSVFIEFL